VRPVSNMSLAGQFWKLHKVAAMDSHPLSRDLKKALHVTVKAQNLG
jgi:hypothetical protein